MENTKFLGLQIDYHLTWKNCIEQMICKLCGLCNAVRSMCSIGNITALKLIYVHVFIISRTWTNFGGIILPIVGRYLLYKRKSSWFYLVHSPELHVEVYLKNYRFLPVPWQYIFLLMNFITINKKNSSKFICTQY
jgi:hypothetical protein